MPATKQRWTQKQMREVAEEERGELGLTNMQPLDPYLIAQEHGIPVYALAELAEHDLPAAAIDHFHHLHATSWSAALIPLGSARIIIENEAQPVERRRSNIAHELGHHLLEHSFAEVLVGEDHKRQFDATQEKQALYLSGQLLIPETAAMRAAYANWDNARVASYFGVSEQFSQMRMSGPRVIARRATAKQRRMRQ